MVKFHMVLLETHFELVYFTLFPSNVFVSMYWLITHGLIQINDDEVELWVVKAIAAKLLDCKMDQMNTVVSVR